MAKQPGIYKIQNRITGKFYIGSTTRVLTSRMSDHRSALRTNSHPNIHLQRSWNKHGEAAFTFQIIEHCDNVLEREQFYIDTLRPHYNINPTARNSEGVKRRKETCIKISVSKLGNKIKLGMSFTEDTKRRISETLKEKYRTGEITHPMQGKKHTPESIELLRQSHKGNSNRRDHPTYTGFVQLDKTTKQPLNTFVTARQAADYIGRLDKPASSKIIRACRTGGIAYGYRWDCVQVKSDELLEA